MSDTPQSDEQNEHTEQAGPPAVDRIEQAGRFLALHNGPEPLLIPNAWDKGSARLLVSLGFSALATTSSGFAASLGKLDGTSCSDEALANATAIVQAAGPVPVSADLENGFGDDPSDVRMTFLTALASGLCGASVEDYSGRADDPIYDEKLAVDRVAAAVSIGHRGPVRMVVTARCENYLRGRPDLKATIARLQAYQEAGADVLYAPGITDLADIKAVVESVDRPVNVLAMPAGPPVAELASVGVKRISVGGAFAFAAYGALVSAAKELRDSGTYGYSAGAMIGRDAVREAFSD